MKHLYILFTFLLVTDLSAQNIIDRKSNLPDTNLTLQLQTQSLIAFALTDSLYADIQYVVDHYTTVLYFSDTVRIKTTNNKKFLKKSPDLTEVLIFNPFSEIDYPFVLKQREDTSSSILADSLITKVLIPEKRLVTKPSILLEKPIFSLDLKQAYLRTSIYFKGGGVGYETYFIYENRKWKKDKFSMTYTYRG